MKIFLLSALLFFMFACKPYGFVRVYKIGDNSALKKAEQLSANKEYEKAIEAYKQHIQERLKIKNRPDWEDPNFYYILIGDLYLAKESVGEALEAYDRAEKSGIDRMLVSDRYRSVALWYEQRKELDKALEILNRYRDRDQLLFDATSDRIAKEIVSRDAEKTE